MPADINQILTAIFADYDGEVLNIKKRVTALENASANKPKGPVFDEPPYISPTTGTAGDTVFTAYEGTIFYAEKTFRRWLLGGTAIGYGPTIVANAAGQLVLEVTALGPGGWTTETSTAVTVQPMATDPTDPTDPDDLPVNLSPPRIDGWPVSGSTVFLAVGDWKGDIDHFEVELQTDSGTSLISQQAAGNGQRFDLNDVEGATLYYVVWAVTPAGERINAESAPFGPVQAGDELILAFALAGTAESRDAVTDVPYPVEVVYGSTADKLYPQANPHHAGLSWGFSAAGANINGLGNIIDYDPRLAGRFASNSSTTMRVDIPQHDTYVLYAASGALGSNSVNLGVFAGGRSGRSLHQIGPTAGGGTNRVVDASGVSRPIPDWAAFSAPGGAGVELAIGGVENPNDPLYISIGRSSLEGSSTPHTIYCALFRKVT